MAVTILDENDKKELEQKIKDAANSAGTDGGHYTPSVKDNGNGTMTISFTASKEGMAAVNPVTITLPVPADGEDGQDGQDGTNGKDGENGGYYTPTVETVTENSFKISFSPSKSGMPAVGDVTITLPAAKDGEDGKDGTNGTNGQDGEDGVGIESVVQTTISTADGGENIITVTLTNGNKSTFKVKNGSKGDKGETGATGADGKDGTNGKDGADGVGIKSIVKTSTSGLVDTYTITLTNNTTTTFAVTNGKDGTNGTNGTNGKDGATGANGKTAYEYAKDGGYTGTETEFSARLAFIASGASVAYIDNSGGLVFSNLPADGEYTAYYEVDGELVEIGKLTVGEEETSEPETKTYTITWVNYDGTVLETDTVTEGEIPAYNGATPTRAEDSQYTYTFKGWDKTVVAAVADATYTAQYTQTAKPADQPKNFADPSSTEWWADSHLGSDASQRTKSGYAVSNYIGPINVGDVIEIKGLDMTGTTAEYRCAPCKSDKSLHGSYGTGALTTLGNLSTAPITGVAVTATGGQFTNNKSDIKYWRIGGKLNGLATDVVINIKRNGAYLTE